MTKGQRKVKEKSMSDSLVYCNLCCRSIEKSHERILFAKGRKQFDIIAEIESLEISLRPIGKYICRNCVAQLKKRRGLLEQLAKLEGELKSSHRKEDSVAVKRTGELPIGDQDAPANKQVRVEAECVPLVETSSPVRPVIRTPRTSLWPVSPISTSGQPQPCQPAMVIEEAENEVSRESGVRNRSVDVSIKVNWPSKPNRERKLPEDLESLGKMLARGTYKQIAILRGKTKT